MLVENYEALREQNALQSQSDRDFSAAPVITIKQMLQKLHATFPSESCSQLSSGNFRCQVMAKVSQTWNDVSTENEF